MAITLADWKAMRASPVTRAAKSSTRRAVAPKKQKRADRAEVESGCTWMGTHVETGDTVRVGRRVDRKLLMSIYLKHGARERQVCQVAVSVFDTIEASFEMMRGLAERLAKAEFKLEDLFQKRDEALTKLGLGKHVRDAKAIKPKVEREAKGEKAEPKVEREAKGKKGARSKAIKPKALPSSVVPYRSRAKKWLKRDAPTGLRFFDHDAGPDIW